MKRAESAARDVAEDGGAPVQVFVADLSSQSEVRRLESSTSRPTPKHSDAWTSTTCRGQRSYSGARAYNQSKLANVLFTYALAGRVRGTSVTANAVHPGLVSTRFGADDPAKVQRLLVPLLRPFMKTPTQGAATRSISPPPQNWRASAANTSQAASSDVPPTPATTKRLQPGCGSTVPTSSASPQPPERPSVATWSVGESHARTGT